ncbi:MAG TPA: glycerol-3-phosphate acyltransferase [Trueperaceae bacterium]|nr:glycerol-3-phosphate acyltransferase [Trueperaceae bacterium]
MTAPLVALALGYLLGGFPTAYLLAKARGKDVFAVGSGSMGAMNTARNVGRALGVAVLLVDAGKGALATLVGGALAGLEPGQDPLLASLLGALGAVAGHCFSPYVGFRGGKGLATAFGALLVVHPLPPLYGLVLLVALLLIVRDGDAAILVTVLLFPVVVLFALDRQGWPREATFLTTTVVAAMSVVGLVRLGVGWLRSRRGVRPEAG